MLNEVDRLMGIETQEPDEASVSDWIKGLKKRKIETFEIPAPYRHSTRLVVAERKAGFRRILECGFDVGANNFFVKDECGFKNPKAVYETENFFFDSFDEFYQFVDGRIYENASFYQYEFNSEEIARYHIDLQKIQRGPFSKETIDDYSWVPTPKEHAEYLIVEEKKAALTSLVLQAKACDNFKDFKATFRQVEKLNPSYSKEFLIFSIMPSDKEKAFKFAMELINSGNDVSGLLAASLCYFYDPDRVEAERNIKDESDSTHYRHAIIFRHFVEAVKNKTVVWTKRLFFDEETHYFIEEASTIYRKDCQAKARLYFETLEAFASHLHGDLSHCDFSELEMPLSAFASYHIGKDTLLPPQCYSRLIRKVDSGYIGPTRGYWVNLSWETADGLLVKTRPFPQAHFVDFVSFLKGNLDQADLLDCYGLEHLYDLTGLHFENAHVRSDVLRALRLPYQPISLPALPTPSSLILTNESGAGESLACVDEGPAEGEVPVFYISDLHLWFRITEAGCITEDDISYLLRKIVRGLVQDAFEAANSSLPYRVLLIGGDIDSNSLLFLHFVEEMSRVKAVVDSSLKVVFVLGNHELWNSPKEGLKGFYDFNKIAIANHGMFLLQNSLLAFNEKGEAKIFSDNELLKMSPSALQRETETDRILIFGGTGFAGYNQEFNADSGNIYRGAIDRAEEIKETEKFNTAYTKVEKALGRRHVIVLTHNPLSDWMSPVEPHPGFVYVNGHNHRNYFSDDGEYRIYADNQIGYREHPIHAKHFYLDGRYDLFDSYPDGIHSISKQQYLDFCRGKNMNFTIEADLQPLYLLKKKGFYCCITESKRHDLIILNGGQKKQLDHKDINYYYENMDKVITSVDSSFWKYSVFQQAIAAKIRNIGGEGKIHGCIIDIDHFNHLYVNPIDQKVTPYFALNMVEKRVYPNLLSLIKARLPMLYKRALVLANQEDHNGLFLAKTGSDVAVDYLETDIYKASRQIRKLQRLPSGILVCWPKGNNTVEFLGNWLIPLPLK
jgi:5''-nucleotidase/2'',3''-cyclic phosphodiesterase and related esterases